MNDLNFKFENLDLIDFQNILNGLDQNVVKKEFLEICSNLNAKSKYYVGKKGNGKFWKGFRINSITCEKIINVLLDEIKKETEEIDVKNLIKIVVEKQYKNLNSENELKREILECGNVSYIESLLKLLEMEQISLQEIDEIKTKNIIEKYEKQISILEKKINDASYFNELSYKKEIDKLIKENSKQKKELIVSEEKSNKLILDFEKKVINAENKYKELLLIIKDKDKSIKSLSEQIDEYKSYENVQNIFNDLLKKVISAQTREKVINHLIDRDFKSKDGIKTEIIRISNVIIEELNKKNNIENYVIELYILNRVLEG